MTDLQRIAAVARPRHGIVSAQELTDLQVTRARRRTLVGSGVLVPVAKGWYRLVGAPASGRQALALAVASTDGVASHRSAAALHELPGFVLPRRPEVTVRTSAQRPRSRLARVHATTWLPDDDLVVVDGIACLTVARTLFSLAAIVPELSVDRVRGAVDDAVRLRRASDPWLWWRLERLRCHGRNGVSVFERILTERAGGSITESWLERESLRVFERGGLPRPVCQARIAKRGAFLARVDFAYPPQRVIIEVTGAVAHSTPAQRAADARRRNELLMQGYLVLEFTYEQVVREPNAVVAQVRAALAQRAAA